MPSRERSLQRYAQTTGSRGERQLPASQARVRTRPRVRLSQPRARGRASLRLLQLKPVRGRRSPPLKKTKRELQSRQRRKDSNKRRKTARGSKKLPGSPSDPRTTSQRRRTSTSVRPTIWSSSSAGSLSGSSKVTLKHQSKKKGRLLLNQRAAQNSKTELGK